MLNKIKTTTLIILILFSALLWAIRPQPIAMRRESARPAPVQGEIIQSLDQALDLSLAMGDGRRVNWEAVGV